MAIFKSTINHYKGQNYQIAIDDAGAGNSGLNLISEVNPNYIKLDRNLIRSDKVHTAMNLNCDIFIKDSYDMLLNYEIVALKLYYIDTNCKWRDKYKFIKIFNEVVKYEIFTWFNPYQNKK